MLRCVQLLEVFMMIFRPSNSAAGGPTYMYLDRYRLTGHCTYPDFIHGSCSSPTPIHCDGRPNVFKKHYVSKPKAYGIQHCVGHCAPAVHTIPVRYVYTPRVRGAVYAARSDQGSQQAQPQLTESQTAVEGSTRIGATPAASIPAARRAAAAAAAARVAAAAGERASASSAIPRRRAGTWRR